MSISGVLNRLSNYHTHLAKHDFLQLRFDYLIPHPTLICPKTITLFFVYELIYVIYLTRLKVFANYLHLLYSNLLIKNSFNLAGLENVWQNCREFMRMCHPKDLHNEKKCATKTHLVLFI